MLSLPSSPPGQCHTHGQFFTSPQCRKIWSHIISLKNFKLVTLLLPTPKYREKKIVEVPEDCGLPIEYPCCFSLTQFTANRAPWLPFTVCCCVRSDLNKLDTSCIGPIEFRNPLLCSHCHSHVFTLCIHV